MKRFIIILLLALFLCSCATRGSIDKIGTVSFDGWEFSNCDNAGSPMSGDNSDFRLCGYSLSELVHIANIKSFYEDKFCGDTNCEWSKKDAIEEER
jgi:hypothetical protein